MDRVTDWCWAPLLVLKNSHDRYRWKEKGIFLMGFKKKKKANQGSEMVCSSGANSSGYAVTPRGRSSLLPQPRQCTRGFPGRGCAVHALSIPLLHTSHRQPVLLLQCLTGCWSHCRSEEDLPPSFTKSLLEQKGGRRGQKLFTPCFGQVALG